MDSLHNPESVSITCCMLALSGHYMPMRPPKTVQKTFVTRSIARVTPLAKVSVGDALLNMPDVSLWVASQAERARTATNTNQGPEADWKCLILVTYLPLDFRRGGKEEAKKRPRVAAHDHQKV